MKNTLFTLLVILSFKLAFAQWQSFVPELYTSFNDMTILDSNHCFAVGSKGKIYQSSNGGISWSELQSNTSENLFSICHVGGVLYVTVPSEGKVLRSSNYQSFNSYQLNGFNGNFVYFYDENNGFVTGGQPGKLAKTTNGGDTWQVIETNFPGYLKKVHFITALNGFAIGQAKENGTVQAVVLKTTDGGNSWQQIHAETSTMYNDIYFTDASNGHVVGSEGKVLRTTNGGTSFTSTTTGVTMMLNDVTFVNMYVGYVVGNMGTILKTYNGGASWEAHNHPQKMLFQKACFQGNVGYISMLGNTILKTSTAGL